MRTVSHQMEKLSLLKMKVTSVLGNGRDGTLYYYGRSLNGQLQEPDNSTYRNTIAAVISINPFLKEENRCLRKH
ncbi:hypothetical protein [Bacteroides thetaiotaomicron]|uniref:hypothetical protein n=1 Tax=Bacteroides thetaiotaomicron TaxID=818 RepID=UPI002164809C|nr:hypothetical protein [Bacteroides thetaiotaomicron]UVR91282.1 hypothetical protein NXV61_25640 [Bacteroides thetaiotaomicron]